MNWSSGPLALRIRRLGFTALTPGKMPDLGLLVVSADRAIQGSVRRVRQCWRMHVWPLLNFYRDRRASPGLATARLPATAMPLVVL